MDDDDWQSNLSDWKKTRKSQSSFQRAQEDHEAMEDQPQKSRPKTFKEMVEERKRRKSGHDAMSFDNFDDDDFDFALSKARSASNDDLNRVGRMSENGFLSASSNHESLVNKESFQKNAETFAEKTEEIKRETVPLLFEGALPPVPPPSAPPPAPPPTSNWPPNNEPQIKKASITDFNLTRDSNRTSNFSSIHGKFESGNVSTSKAKSSAGVGTHAVGSANFSDKLKMWNKPTDVVSSTPKHSDHRNASRQMTGRENAFHAGSSNMFFEKTIRINQRPNHEKGFGFSITGGREFNAPIIVDKVVRGGSADICELKAGDEIIAINGANVGGHYNDSVQKVLAQAVANGTIELKVKRLKDLDDEFEEEVFSDDERKHDEVNKRSSVLSESQLSQWSSPPSSPPALPSIADTSDDMLPPPPLPSVPPPPPNWNTFPGAIFEADEIVAATPLVSHSDHVPFESSSIIRASSNHTENQLKDSQDNNKEDILRRKSQFFGLKLEETEEFKAMKEENEKKSKFGQSSNAELMKSFSISDSRSLTHPSSPSPPPPPLPPGNRISVRHSSEFLDVKVNGKGSFPSHSFGGLSSSGGSTPTEWSRADTIHADELRLQEEKEQQRLKEKEKELKQKEELIRQEEQRLQQEKERLNRDAEQRLSAERQRLQRETEEKLQLERARMLREKEEHIRLEQERLEREKDEKIRRQSEQHLKVEIERLKREKDEQLKVETERMRWEKEEAIRREKEQLQRERERHEKEVEERLRTEQERNRIELERDQRRKEEELERKKREHEQERRLIEQEQERRRIEQEQERRRIEQEQERRRIEQDQEWRRKDEEMDALYGTKMTRKPSVEPSDSDVAEYSMKYGGKTFARLAAHARSESLDDYGPKKSVPKGNVGGKGEAFTRMASMHDSGHGQATHGLPLNTQYDRSEINSSISSIKSNFEKPKTPTGRMSEPVPWKGGDHWQKDDGLTGHLRDLEHRSEVQAKSSLPWQGQHSSHFAPEVQERTTSLEPHVAGLKQNASHFGPKVNDRTSSLGSHYGSRDSHQNVHPDQKFTHNVPKVSEHVPVKERQDWSSSVGHPLREHSHSQVKPVEKPVHGDQNGHPSLSNITYLLYGEGRNASNAGAANGVTPGGYNNAAVGHQKPIGSSGSPSFHDTRDLHSKHLPDKTPLRKSEEFPSHQHLPVHQFNESWPSAKSGMYAKDDIYQKPAKSVSPRPLDTQWKYSSGVGDHWLVEEAERRRVAEQTGQERAWNMGHSSQGASSWNQPHDDRSRTLPHRGSRSEHSPDAMYSNTPLTPHGSKSHPAADLHPLRSPRSVQEPVKQQLLHRINVASGGGKAPSSLGPLPSYPVAHSNLVPSHSRSVSNPITDPLQFQPPGRPSFPASASSLSPLGYQSTGGAVDSLFAYHQSNQPGTNLTSQQSLSRSQGSLHLDGTPQYTDFSYSKLQSYPRSNHPCDMEPRSQSYTVYTKDAGYSSGRKVEAFSPYLQPMANKMLCGKCGNPLTEISGRVLMEGGDLRLRCHICYKENEVKFSKV